jgi:type IV secretion system protein TrbL
MKSGYITLIVVIALLFTTDAIAGTGISSSGILDGVLERFKQSASQWGVRIEAAAIWLFVTLAIISLAWTFITLSMKRGEAGDILAELVIFTVTTGFFLWLLQNGTNFTLDIIASMRKLAGDATGLGDQLYPSQIVDIGFKVFSSVMSNSSVWNPTDTLVGFIISAVIIVVLALIAVNMLLLLIASWFLAYAGIFFLGFGGGKWTSDMAINYYKTVLGIGVQIFAMILIIGVGQDIIKDVERGMTAGMNLGDLAVLLVVSICLLLLVEKIPAMLAGIITGQATGGMGVGAFGAGAAVAGTAALAAATGSATKAMEAFTTQMGGLGSAMSAALEKTHDNMASGGGMFQGASGSTGGKAGAFVSDLLQNLSSGVAAEGKSMFDEKMGQAKEAIGDTFGGRAAEHIKSSGATNFDMDGVMPTPSNPEAGSAGGGEGGEGAESGGWINETGGYNALSPEDQAKASESHAEWQDSNPDRNTYGVEDYVSYVQDKQQERNASMSNLSDSARNEINEFVEKGKD